MESYQFSPEFLRLFGHLAEIRHADLKRTKLVPSRATQCRLIKSGRLEPPLKKGKANNSSAVFTPQQIDRFMRAELERSKQFQQQQSAA